MTNSNFLWQASLKIILIISASTHVYASAATPQLHLAETLPIFPAGAVGPESFAFDPLGQGPYTGVSDGRILKWDEARHRWNDFATVSSSPRSITSNSCYKMYYKGLTSRLLDSLTKTTPPSATTFYWQFMKLVADSLLQFGRFGMDRL
ncbi:hypothetical protein QQ045_017492 [Rhodiola kirilowii]